MPKELTEFAKLETGEARQGGKKVDWDKVADRINASGEAYSVKEVWENFAEKRVTQFRTKNALDNLFEKGKVSRKYDGRRFWYGPREA